MAVTENAARDKLISARREKIDHPLFLPRLVCYISLSFRFLSSLMISRAFDPDFLLIPAKFSPFSLS